MTNNFERRSLVTTSIEARSASNKKFLVGRAAAYNTLSADLGGFREIIAPGAFTRAIREKDDCIFTLNHDASALPLGRVSSGTLTLSEDSLGLNFRCDLPNTQAAKDLFESVSRGDIRECSFAFNVPEDGGDDWDIELDKNGKQFVRRTLREINPLADVSAVLHPAYPVGTNVSTDMLTAKNVSSLQVSRRALMEARSRGGAVAKPRFAPAAPLSLYELRKQAEARGKKFVAEAYEEGLADFVNSRPRHTHEVQGE